MTRIRPLAVAVVSIVLGSLSACGSRDRPSPEPEPSSGPFAASAEALGLSECPDGPLTHPARSDGSALAVTVVSQKSAASGWDIALDSAAMAQYPELLKEGPFVGFDGLDKALDDGVAYTNGGAQIALNVDNRAGRPVTIHDLRPVNIQVRCRPDGLLVQYGSEGGDFVELGFDLEAAIPRAHRIRDTGEIDDGFYFDGSRIEVAAGQPSELVANLFVAHRAFSFDLGIFYVVDGARHVQVVRPAKGPFLTTADDCPSSRIEAGLTDQQRSLLREHRFREIRRREVQNSEYVVRAFPPDRYTRPCEPR